MVKYKTFQLNKPPILNKNKNKNRFQEFIPEQRTALLVLPRYDHKLSRSIVEGYRFKIDEGFKSIIALCKGKIIIC